MKVKQYEESAFAGNKPLKILSIVVPSYFDNRNISFVIKFKPFPALTNNTIQQFQISKPYKKSL